MWTPASLESPGVRDDLGMAGNPLCQAALCASLVVGVSGHKANAGSVQIWQQAEDIGIWRCSRAEATEDGSICAGLSLSITGIMITMAVTITIADIYCLNATGTVLAHSVHCLGILHKTSYDIGAIVRQRN